MATTVSRRDFVKYGVGAGAGVAVVALGANQVIDMLQGGGTPATLKVSVTITDIMKEMVTHNPINEAKCYFWIYKVTADGVDIPAECPGPTIVVSRGDTIDITINNSLDEAHAFFIPGIFDSGPVAPGKTIQKTFTVNMSGAFMYYDNLNAPVNRVMGLHGAMVVMPAAPASGYKYTPYDSPSPNVQAIFDSFGTPTYPGLAWEQEDAATKTPAFRQYLWLTHEASSRLFAEVGAAAPGVDYNANDFVTKFTKGQFKNNNSAISKDKAYTPEYFTINGQSGFFSHFSPYCTPTNRVGEPVVVHALNAGLWIHSMHIHANHCYVTSINGQVQSNPLWLDTMTLLPGGGFDYVMPYMRPPDVPNVRGIGRPDAPQAATGTSKAVWPPPEEFNMFLPVSASAKDIHGNAIELKQRQSPLCYPMHDHSEPTQTAQGGNYNCGLISGMYFVGDRNTMMDFPIDHDFGMMYREVRGISGAYKSVTDPYASVNGVYPAAGVPPVHVP